MECSAAIFNMKRYLFVLRKPPHSGAQVQEMLDIILTTAAFDQHVSILLLDDGVFQLKNGQNPEIAGIKISQPFLRHCMMLMMLYEVESLQERGLRLGDLCLPVQEFYRKRDSRIDEAV